MSKLEIKRLGAIDIGSNAIRCLITSVAKNDNDVKYKKLTLVRVPIRLGEDVFTNDEISEKKKIRLINAMQSYSFLFKAFEVDNYRACATSAMREASNGKAIIDKIKQQSGISVDIISGSEEAKIIFDAGISSFLDNDKSYLYVDVGGGSTELTVFSEHKIVASKSFKVGTVRLLHHKAPSNEWDKMRLWLGTNVSNKKIECLIGSGGNINKLVKLAPSLEKEKCIEKKDLKLLFADLNELTYEERIEKYGMNPDRADVIIPAAKIFLTILRWTKTDYIFAPKFGLADGIIHLLDEY